MSPLLMPLAAVDYEACNALCFASASVQQAIIHIELCQKTLLQMEKWRFLNGKECNFYFFWLLKSEN